MKMKTSELTGKPLNLMVTGGEGMNIAFVDWSLDIDCPHCEKEVDLVQYEADSGDNSIAGRIFTNQWDDLKEFVIECPHCHNDFTIDKVEY